MTHPSDETLCPHLQAGRWPFEPELLLDEHLGPTDVLMRCRHCDRRYLLEMLDWRSTARVMRVATLAAEEAERFVRDLSRGSCDVDRAGAEVAHLRTRAPFTRWLLLMDTAGPRVEALASVPDGVKIPAASWRDLPCDGSWVDYVRSHRER